ncbi:MAG: GntR family transcriptional regulator [Candidatus Cryptobacteroides sp.]
MKLDPNSSTPLHRQAEELLREMIKEEDYRNGKLLPNEVDLSKSLNISRNTLRQAINKLVFEGLLIRKKGYGTCVAPQDVMSNARNWMSFSQEMAAQGMKVQNFELHLSWKLPPKEASAFFGSAPEKKLLCLERLRGKPDLPFVFFISYFNPNIPMSVSEDMSRPLYEILQKTYGIKVKTSKEQISARGASSTIAEKLDISEGAPILVRKRFVFDDKGTPIEYNIGYYRADSFTYSIECTNE